ncbi:phosphoglycerate mutase-like protein [Exidia glandulosa HHB12029]|uniref:Phosphoglycerate mutase-like protein n=1 Tax=Exidia glandulosa HHB12029 TaxID=1314781 RepID=A0A165DCN6_EXIGL|nr:phosphoglycerate mutase-like protein [Exidia glandulosa HHB12029]
MGLDVDAYPEAPQQLELQQVHLFIRHGERTPVTTRMSDAPASIPPHWLMCKTARAFRASVHDTTDAAAVFHSLANPESAGEKLMPVRRLVERPDGTAVDGECMLGELTDIGRRSTLQYGQALRRLYVDRDSAMLYFRSTNMPRTIESLQHIIQGLYPPQKYMNGLIPRILVRNGADENLVGNVFACKRLDMMKYAFAQAAAEAWNPHLERLDPKLSKYIDGNSVRIDGKPRASGILDTAAVAHGVRVPSDFQDPSVVGLLEKAVCAEWFSGYKNEEFRRLAMGRLLDDLQRKMQLKAEGVTKQPRLLVHSTHDTALAGLCQTLDVYDERWPPFTASITFELFRHKPVFAGPRSWLQAVGLSSSGAPSQYYVRMRYENRNLELPLCAGAGKHLPGSPEFCTLEAFQTRVRELTPQDWEYECEQNPTSLRR